MKAAEIMTKDVVTVEPGATVRDVAMLLRDKRISAVPVVEPGRKVIGIVSEGDLMRRAELGLERHHSWWSRLFNDPDMLAAEYIKSHARKARDLMTRPVVAVGEDTPVADIVELMESRHIKRVPVTRDGVLVGVVSRADILRALIAAGDRIADAVPADKALHERLMAELKAQPWWRGGGVEILVTGGVAHLWGLVNSREEADAIRVAAENVSGVRGVKNHLVVQPISAMVV
jgi:CBS domain-containing protein